MAGNMGMPPNLRAVAETRNTTTTTNNRPAAEPQAPTSVFNAQQVQTPPASPILKILRQKQEKP
jgi:hypothetical protein